MRAGGQDTAAVGSRTRHREHRQPVSALTHPGTPLTHTDTSESDNGFQKDPSSEWLVGEHSAGEREQWEWYRGRGGGCGWCNHGQSWQHRQVCNLCLCLILSIWTFENVAARSLLESRVLNIIIRIQFVEIWNYITRTYIMLSETLLNYKMFSSLPCRILKTNCQIWFMSTKKKCLAAPLKRCPPVLWCVVIRFLNTK